MKRPDSRPMPRRRPITPVLGLPRPAWPWVGAPHGIPTAAAPSPCHVVASRLPAQWSTIPADELHHRQQAAQLLIAAGHTAALTHLDQTAAGLLWWCRANPVAPTSAPC
jgi:hypothetical protein